VPDGRDRTFVGFGFGAIQGGLFLYEAFRSANFGRLVVAEVLDDVVDAVRLAGGIYSVNIAHKAGVDVAAVGPIEIQRPHAEADRERIVEAISRATEIATAVPSVRHYVSRGAESLHRILALGLRKKIAEDGPRAVIYAAENQNHAAEILQEAVFSEIPESERGEVESRTRFLNTVIGKMSGVVADPSEVRDRNLTTIAPGIARAFLVEEFNRILISRIRFDDSDPEGPYSRGITIFDEKDELLPFEEAKLYGHNAAHALMAYLGAVRGVARIADLRSIPELIEFVRRAFLEESGEALIRKYAGVDRLFTPQGYQEYADDLLARMLNPHLHDTVERVGRDPERKLGWDDRLIGTMRLALSQGIRPRRFAVGAAAALASVVPETLETDVSATGPCDAIWENARPPKEEAGQILELIENGGCVLRRWRQSGFVDLALRTNRNRR